MTSQQKVPVHENPMHAVVISAPVHNVASQTPLNVFGAILFRAYTFPPFAVLPNSNR